MLEYNVKMSRNMNLSDFLNILFYNSKHLDILNFLIFAILCIKRSYNVNYNSCFQHEYLRDKRLYIYYFLIKFLIHSYF